MAPKDKNFTREVECFLIHHVHQCPMLWNVSCKEYRRNDLKRGQWHRIAESLGPQFTGEAVNKRFENMASIFRDNNRRVREAVNRCSGKGTDDMYRPKWEYYEILSFLKKTCAQSESIDNISRPLTSSCGGPAVQLDLQSQHDTPLTVYFDQNTNMFTMIPDDDSSSISPRSIPFVPYNPQPIDEDSPRSLEVADTSSDVGSVVPPVAAFSPPPRPASAPSGFKRPVHDPPYVKRGSSKKSAVDDAVEAIKNLVKHEPPLPEFDHFDKFGSYIAFRSRNMSADDQQHYETELLRVLSKPRQS